MFWVFENEWSFLLLMLKKLIQSMQSITCYGVLGFWGFGEIGRAHV